MANLETGDYEKFLDLMRHIILGKYCCDIINRINYLYCKNVRFVQYETKSVWEDVYIDSVVYSVSLSLFLGCCWH